MGENLTIRGLDRHLFRAGQRYRVGAAVVELTRIRIPCSQQNVFGAGIQGEIYDARVKSGDVHSPRWAMSGFYASVIEPGLVRTGDRISLLSELA